jgi:hypothetical protein
VLDEPLFAYVRANDVGPGEGEEFRYCGFDQGELLGDERRVGHAGSLAIKASQRLEVEILVPCLDLEAEPGGSIAVEEDDPVAHDPVHEVRGRFVQDDDWRP